MFALRNDSNKFNFHAFVSPSTFIRKTGTEIKDSGTITSKEKSERKRGRNKERTHQN
jgi:hypothetical protein